MGVLPDWQQSGGTFLVSVVFILFLYVICIGAFAPLVVASPQDGRVGSRHLFMGVLPDWQQSGGTFLVSFLYLVLF